MVNLYQRTSQTHKLGCNIIQGSETQGKLRALYKKIAQNVYGWHLDAESKLDSMHFTGHKTVHNEQIITLKHLSPAKYNTT